MAYDVDACAAVIERENDPAMLVLKAFSAPEKEDPYKGQSPFAPRDK